MLLLQQTNQDNLSGDITTTTKNMRDKQLVQDAPMVHKMIPCIFIVQFVKAIRLDKSKLFFTL